MDAKPVVVTLAISLEEFDLVLDGLSEVASVRFVDVAHSTAVEMFKEYSTNPDKAPSLDSILGSAHSSMEDKKRLLDETITLLRAKLIQAKQAAITANLITEYDAFDGEGGNG